MPNLRRVVVDTNVFVNAPALTRSVPSLAVNKALDTGVLLVSEATLTELGEVLRRKKLERYVSGEERRNFLNQLSNTAEFVRANQVVRECRDPNDDKFLELALSGRADVIITGDADLLALHPWRKIEILSPQNFSPDS